MHALTLEQAVFFRNYIRYWALFMSQALVVPLCSNLLSQRDFKISM